MDQPTVSTTGKKAYSQPALVVYGSIAKLTQSGTGSGADGGLVAGMTMGAPCL